MRPAEISLLNIIEAVDNVFGEVGDLQLEGLDSQSVAMVERTLADVTSNSRSLLSAIPLSSLRATLLAR